MLQKAAGNTYSWWWASHIRTKQSKWLEQSLQDMEGKVDHVLNLIQKDGDSFAKRAEMYYRHRPELIAFVEETVRAYRALAERYDKLSTDLQKANNTIASICPDQVTYDMDDDDDYIDGLPKTPKTLPQNTPKTPKTPKSPTKDFRVALNNASNINEAKQKLKPLRTTENERELIKTEENPDGIQHSDETRTDSRVQELESAIEERDNEIQLLKQKLKALEDTLNEDKVEGGSDDVPSEETVSAVEEKLRMKIDAILEENLNFWMRFSTAFHRIQKFKNGIKDLQEEVKKVKRKGIEGKSSMSLFTTDLRSDIRPIYKHLNEIKNELTAWLEQSTLLKDELQKQYSSLSNIQEEIIRALREGVEEEKIKFSTHQAAKFQGEVLNMKQENNKVNEELQAGLDHVTALKFETEKTLERLDEEFGLLPKQIQPRQGRSSGQSGIPLRSFIFGVKPKKQRLSLFACITHPKKFSAYKGGRH